MDLTIVQRLVCPVAHESAPLVVRADIADHGRLQQGMLGCPVCGTEWPVEAGVAKFGPRAAIAPVRAHDTVTLAALLGLTEPKVVITDGVAADVMVALVREYGASVVALDADDTAESASVIDGAQVIPLADHVADGVALLRARDPGFVASAVRCLAPAGRMVAPPALAVPPGMREIARNDDLWVAEREPEVAVVSLRRRS